MNPRDIIIRHGLHDGLDEIRMEQALSAAEMIPEETLEDIFLNLLSLERKGLILYDTLTSSGKEIH